MAESNYHTELESAGITVVSRLFKTQDDPTETVNDLFVRTFQGSYTSVVIIIINASIAAGERRLSHLFHQQLYGTCKKDHL